MGMKPLRHGRDRRVLPVAVYPTPPAARVFSAAVVAGTLYEVILDSEVFGDPSGVQLFVGDTVGGFLTVGITMIDSLTFRFDSGSASSLAWVEEIGDLRTNRNAPLDCRAFAT